MTPKTVHEKITTGLAANGIKVEPRGSSLVTDDHFSLPISMVLVGAGSYPNLLAGNREPEYRLYYGWEKARKWMKVQDSMDLDRVVEVLAAWVKRKRLDEEAQDRGDALAEAIEVGTPGVRVTRSCCEGKVRIVAEIHVTPEQARRIIAAIEGNTGL